MSKHSNQNYGETAELMKRGGLSIKKNICRRNDINTQQECQIYENNEQALKPELWRNSRTNEKRRVKHKKEYL